MTEDARPHRSEGFVTPTPYNVQVILKSTVVENLLMDGTNGQLITPMNQKNRNWQAGKTLKRSVLFCLLIGILGEFHADGIKMSSPWHDE